jgi:FkbM family methyltransferase
MLKKRLVNAIGRHNCLRYIKPVSDLYHSACVPFKADGLEIIKHHLIPRGGTVLDIGANVGQFTAFAAPLVGRRGKVYGFEPVASALVTLKRMVALRRFHNVRIVDTALSCRTGTADIKIPLKDGWKPQVTIAHLNGVAGGDTRIEPVQVQTLDGFCKPVSSVKSKNLISSVPTCTLLQCLNFSPGWVIKVIYQPHRATCTPLQVIK